MVELISIALLLGVASAVVAYRPVRDWISKPALESADYVIFRAAPSLLPDLRADLSEAGWQWISTLKEDDDCLHRFEKTNGRSATLAKIWQADGVMQRTANRTEGASLIVSVDGFGRRKNESA